MRGSLQASIVALAVQAAAMPAVAQELVLKGGDPGVIVQSIGVPVFPGQLLDATVALPAREQTPLPLVLLLVVREPGSAPGAAAGAVSEALLGRGIAVVKLELPPAVDADGGEPMLQPADDAFAVLQFMRQREDIDGDRVALVGVGAAARFAVRAAALDEGLRALVLLGAGTPSRDSLDLPTRLPLLALPLEIRAAPDGVAASSPVADTVAFLSRHIQ